MLSVFGAALGIVVLGATELGAGAQATAEAGFAPIAPGEPSDPAVAFTLVPEASITWYARRRALTLRYAPRFYTRHPNLLGTARPLLLHRGFVEYGEVLSRRVRLATLVSGSMGEVDYSSQALVFHEAQTTPARRAVIEMATVSGGPTVTVRSTRRLHLMVGAHAMHSRPLDESAGIAATSRVVGMLGQRWQHTRRDVLGTSLAAGQAWFGGGPRYWVMARL